MNKFSELNKGDHFIFEESYMVKVQKIKDGNDGCFYTAVDISTGTHYKINDDTDVLKAHLKVTGYTEE